MLSFYDYIKAELTNKELPLYVKKIADRIEEKIYLNQFPRILIITMPPRSLKTTITLDYFPLWALEYCQSYVSNISLFSYSGYLIDEKIKNFPKRLRSQIYKASSSQIGFKESNIFIIDDYCKSIEESESILMSDTTFKVFNDIVKNKLNSNPFILIMASRWGKNDLIGRILKDINNFLIDYINIPALALEYDIFGRKQGESFWPEKYPKEVLLTLKDTVGEKWFETSFQGNPK